MAFSRSRIDDKQEGESFGNVSIEVAATLSRILKPRPLDQGNDQILEGCQNIFSGPYRHAGGIFVKGDIPPIVQAGFNIPVQSSELQQLSCRYPVPGKAGDAILGFTVGLIDFAGSDPGELAHQPIDLGYAWPIQVVVEHGAGFDGAFLKAAMTAIGFGGRLEIGGDLAKAWFRLIRGKQALNSFIQPGLIFFDQENVVTLGCHNCR
jgi:hypothetical protein